MGRFSWGCKISTHLSKYLGDQLLDCRVRLCLALGIPIHMLSSTVSAPEPQGVGWGVVPSAKTSV